jgi:hypothetical protein
METINKEFKLGLAIFNFKIVDGVAIMTSNDPKVTKQCYENCKKQKEFEVSYNSRLNAMIEKFPGRKAEEIVKMIEIDMDNANKEQERASKMAHRRLQKPQGEKK